MKILIIDANEEQARSFAQILKREDHVCELGLTYHEGYRKIISFDYDCVLLELTIPGGVAEDLITLLRESEEKDTGLIVYGPNLEVERRIAVLNAGADDVLPLPLHSEELKARIRAVTRRKDKLFQPNLELGDLLIRQAEKEVWFEGNPLQLTRKEFNILLLLARNKNRVITKESLAEQLWGDYMEEAPSFDFLYAHLKNLRKKMEQAGCGNYLKTLYGVGYKLAVD